MSKALKEMRQKIKSDVTRLDNNIFLLDYKGDYYLDELLESGVSNIAALIGYAVKKMNITGKIELGDEKGAGCTTFDVFNSEGNHLLARNFDFKEAPCFVLWTHPKNHYASISMVDNNFMLYGNNVNTEGKGNARNAILAPYCCVDGLNEKGLSIAVLQLRASATNQKDESKKNITTTAMIRAVLDTCSNIDEAIELIKSYNMHDSLWTNYHYQIVDRSGRSVIVEYISDKIHIFEKGNDKYPVCGSVYEGDNLPVQYVSNFSILKDIGDFKVEQHGYDRIKAVTDVLSSNKGIMSEMEAMTLLSHVRLKYKHNKYPWSIIALWSAVYNTEEGTVLIAANDDYKKVYKFSITEPGKVLSTQSVENSPYPEIDWHH